MLTKKLQDWLKNSASEKFQAEESCKNKNKGDGRKHYHRDERHQPHYSDNATGFSEETPPRSQNAGMEDILGGKSDQNIKGTDEEFGALALGNVSEKVQNIDNDVEGHDKDTCESDERKISNLDFADGEEALNQF